MLLLPSAALADVHLTCGNLPITVSSPTPEVAQQTCEAASTALDLLATCTLETNQPISIEIVPDIADMPHNCVAQFDCSTDMIEVVAPSVLARSDVVQGRFSEIPEAVLFESLVAHELTHAVLSHHSAGEGLQREAQEYIAYAMQILSLPEAEQQLFMTDDADGRRITMSDLNMIILAMAPDLFASRAATHFTEPGNGCGFVGDLLDGRVRFPELPQ